MAYDAMGNWTGGYMLTPMGMEEETEEERRRRLGLPPLGPKSAPVAPTATPATQPAAPVSPDMAAIRQVESGNRDFDEQGRPIVSPKGAMYASQVMPTTARDPGFGVRPAQSDTPEEYNRVGQEYFDALLKRYGGDREKALAAYNAGPGRVDQNLAANQGQLNIGQLPKETQDYIPRVLNQVAGGLNPAARTVGMPNARVPAPNLQMPNAAQPAQQPTGNAEPMLGSGLRMTPGTPQITQIGDIQRLIEAGMNPDKLSVLAADEYADPAARIIANRLEATAVKQKTETERTTKEMEEKVRTGDTLGLAKMLRSKDTGNLAKAIFFGFVGAKDLAREELARMGYGATPTVAEVNGQQAYITTTPMGSPVEGYYLSGPRAGQALPPEELVMAGQSVLRGQWTVGKENVLLDTTTGRRYAPGSNNRGQTALLDLQGGAPFKGDPKNLVQERVRTAQAIADIDLTKRLKAKHGVNVIDAEKEYTSIYGPFRSVEDRQAFYNAYQYGGGAPTTAGGVTGTAPAPGAAPGAAPAPGAPAGAAPAPAKAAAPATADIPTPNPNLQQGTAAARIALENVGKRTADFNKKIDTEYAEEGTKADSVVSARKRQRDILERVDPTTGKPVGELLSGYLTAPAGSKTEQSLTIIRDMIANGKPEQQINQRMAQLGLSPFAQSALREFEAENVRIAAQTLKEVAGPGAVSQPEQQLNKEANLDIGRTPLLGTYNQIAQSQFQADMKRYKSDYASGPGNTATNVGQFERDWRRISQNISRAYLDISRKRADFIARNGATPDAVRKGYQKYPVPEYDPGMNDGQGGWKYLKPLDEIMGR